MQVCPNLGAASTSTKVETRGSHTALIGNQTDMEVEVVKIQKIGKLSQRLTSKCFTVSTSVTILLLDFHLRLISYEIASPILEPGCCTEVDFVRKNEQTTEFRAHLHSCHIRSNDRDFYCLSGSALSNMSSAAAMEALMERIRGKVRIWIRTPWWI